MARSPGPPETGAGLDRLGDEDVRELVPDDVHGHRVFRLRDAGVHRLVEEGLREFAVEHRGDLAPALAKAVSAGQPPGTGSASR